MKPISPETESHPQAWGEASTGSGRPRSPQAARIRKPRAITRRIRLSDSTPIRRPAAAKARAEKAQQVAVPRAASWPSHSGEEMEAAGTGAELSGKEKSWARALWRAGAAMLGGAL